MSDTAKTVRFAAILLLFLSLFSCRGGKEDVTIGLSTESLVHDYWIRMKESIISEADLYSMNVINYTTTESSDEKQIEDIRRAIDDRVDYLIIGAYANSESIAPWLKRAKEEGIRIIAVGMRLLDPSVDVNIHIDENYASAQVASLFKDYFQENGISDGAVIMITGDEDDPNAHDRISGLVDILNLMNIAPLVYFSKNWETALSEKQALRMVEKDPGRIKGLFGGSALATISIAHILEKYPLPVLAVGFDLNDEIKKEVTDGTIYGVIYQNPEGIGRKAVDTIQALEKGERVEPTIISDTIVLTKENIEGY